MGAVDEFDLAEASDDGEDSAPRQRRHRRSRPWPWALAALALVGLGAANAGSGAIVLGLGDGVDVGLLQLDVTEEPTVIWQTPLAFAAAEVVGDGIAVAYEPDVVGQDVLGIDLATGAEVWRYHDEAGTCSRSIPVVCVDDAGVTAATIVTIALADGTRHARPHPGAVAAAAAGEDLVVIEATGDVEEVVVLIEPDGAERWRVAADAAELTSDPIYAQLRVTSSAVAIDFSGFEIDLATGTRSPITRYPYSDGFEVEVGDQGGIVVSTPDGPVSLAADEAWLSMDDDLGGPVMLQQGADGVWGAARRIDGSQLWQLTTLECYPWARVRGTVATQCWGTAGQPLLGVDLLTGETLWELPTGLLVGASGDTLLVADSSESALLAIDPTDGSLRWSLPMSTGSFASLTEIPDGVLVATETDLLRLAWD